MPTSVQSITPLVGRILVESEKRERPGNAQQEHAELHLFYNRPTSGSAYAPVGQRLLPPTAPGWPGWPGWPRGRGRGRR